MTTDLSVRIGGIHFRGYADEDDFGFWIGKGGWEGWEGPPSARSNDSSRPTSHGTTDSKQYLDQREVVQTGFFRAPDAETLGHMSNRIASILAGGQRDQLLVSHLGSDLYGNARRGLTQPRVATTSDGTLHVGEYEITYRLPDPRKYGAENRYPASPGATVQVAHYGNFDAFVEVEIPNGPSSYSITSATGVYTVTGATAGGTHRVQLRNGIVTRNGVVMPGVGRGALWTVPPGLPATECSISVAGDFIVPDTFI